MRWSYIPTDEEAADYAARLAASEAAIAMILRWLDPVAAIVALFGLALIARAAWPAIVSAFS